MIAEKIAVEKTEVFDALFRQIEEWVEEENERMARGKSKAKETKWKVTRNAAELRAAYDSEIQTITLPDEDRVTFEVAGQQYDGRFVVNLYAWPTLIRMRLTNKPGSPLWEMETDAGVSFYNDWNQANFTRLIRDLTTIH